MEMMDGAAIPQRRVQHAPSRRFPEFLQPPIQASKFFKLKWYFIIFFFQKINKFKIEEGNCFVLLS